MRTRISLKLMKKLLVLCVGAAILGGIATAPFTLEPSQQVVAQDPRPRPAPREPLGGRDERRPIEPGSSSRRPPSAPPYEEGLTPDERVNIAVYENVNRSVVNINTKATRGEVLFVFEVYSEGAGSGAVVDQDGHVLTNFHVIEGAEVIQVTLFDGKSYDAKVVGGDETSDVAVLKIDAPRESLFPVVFGESGRLRVGQRVFAIGNPFGLERTLTTGIISSLNRTLPSRSGRTMKSIIQIDAAINPGSSGGPLLDTHSRLIGMNTAIASSTGQNTGVGFAIPVNTIALVVPQLIERGKVIRPDAGILKVYQTDHGLLIAQLAPKGPAERAGLRGPAIARRRKRQGPFSYDQQTVDRGAADLIVAVDGTPITTADEFLTQIESRRPGDQTVLTVVRAGQQVEIAIQLAAAE